MTPSHHGFGFRIDRRSLVLRAAPWIAAACGAFIVIVCFYPGQMNADSLAQLAEARSGFYENWHPPIMSWWWSHLEPVVAGPLGMLIFHNFLFWTGLACLLGDRLPPLTAAAATLTIGLVPSCFPLLGTIWKDTGMGAALLLAMALINYFGRTRSWPALGGAALLLFYGCAVRKNAATAVIPIACWAGLLWAGNDAGTSRRWLAGSTALFAVGAIFMVIQSTNAALAHPRTSFQSQQLFLHDLAAISLARRENVLPDYLQNRPDAPTLVALQTIYSAQSVNPLIFGDGPRIPLTQEKTEYDRLRQQWWREIFRNPTVYLRHRTAVFAATLGLSPETVYPFHWGINENHFGYAMNDSRLFNRAMRVLFFLKNSLFFRGWFFALLGALAAVVSIYRGVNCDLVLTLAASGAAYVVPYFLISPAGDFRLIWWMVVAVLIALPLCLAPKPITEFNHRTHPGPATTS